MPLADSVQRVRTKDQRARPRGGREDEGIGWFSAGVRERRKRPRGAGKSPRGMRGGPLGAVSARVPTQRRGETMDIGPQDIDHARDGLGRVLPSQTPVTLQWPVDEELENIEGQEEQGEDAAMALPSVVKTCSKRQCCVHWLKPVFSRCQAPVRRAGLGGPRGAGSPGPPPASTTGGAVEAAGPPTRRRRGPRGWAQRRSPRSGIGHSPTTRGARGRRHPR